MDCCLLSQEEVGRLEHYNLLPNHEEHTHIPAAEAIAGLKDDSLLLITSRTGRNYVTLPKLHFLRALPSGPSQIKVIQRVVSNHISELKPLR